MSGSQKIPEHFSPCDLNMGYADLIGPLYCDTAASRERLGMRIELHHCNLSKIAHGGLLVSLADIAMGRLGMKHLGNHASCLTVNLHYDFFKSAALGSWLEARPGIERKGKKLAFIRCELYADEEVVGHSRCLLKYHGERSHQSN